MSPFWNGISVGFVLGVCATVILLGGLAMRRASTHKEK